MDVGIGVFEDVFFENSLMNICSIAVDVYMFIIRIPVPSG